MIFSVILIIKLSDGEAKALGYSMFLLYFLFVAGPLRNPCLSEHRRLVGRPCGVRRGKSAEGAGRGRSRAEGADKAERGRGGGGWWRPQGETENESDVW